MICPYDQKLFRRTSQCNNTTSHSTTAATAWDLGHFAELTEKLWCGLAANLNVYGRAAQQVSLVSNETKKTYMVHHIYQDDFHWVMKMNPGKYIWDWAKSYPQDGPQSIFKISNIQSMGNQHYSTTQSKTQSKSSFFSRVKTNKLLSYELGVDIYLKFKMCTLKVGSSLKLFTSGI